MSTTPKNTKETNVLNYNINVLSSIKAYKQELATLGHCVRALLQAENIPLHASMLSILKDIKNDKNGAYKKAIENVRKSKTGKFTVFTLLQYLYKQAKK